MSKAANYTHSYYSCNNNNVEKSNFSEVPKSRSLCNDGDNDKDASRVFNVYKESKNQLATKDDVTNFEGSHDPIDLSRLKNEIKSNNEKYQNDDESEYDEDDDRFWFDDFKVMFDAERICEFVPSGDLPYNRRLNAIARFAIYLFIIVFILTRQTNMIYILIIALAVTIYMKTYNVGSFSEFSFSAFFNNINILNAKLDKCNNSHNDNNGNNSNNGNTKNLPEDSEDSEYEYEYEVEEAEQPSNNTPVKVEKLSDPPSENSKGRFNNNLYKAVSELEGNMLQERHQLSNLVQEDYLKQNPAEYFYGKNLKRHQYV